MGRAPCCDKMGVKKGPWTLDEDQILVSYINKHGHGNWRALPKQAGLLRCGKSCRLRWTNYLRPDIKRGNFSPEEEDHIIKLHQLIGNRWSTIASHLPGRTDNEIKNVWNTHLKKRLARMKAESVALEAAPSSSLDSSTIEMTDHGSSPSTQILCNSDARAPSAWEEICTDPVYVLPELSEDVISSSYNMSSSAIDYPSTSTDSTLDVIQSDRIDSLELEIDHNRLPFDTFDEPESQPLSRDLQNIFDQNNFEDPAAGKAAISHDDNAEMVNSSSSQGMKSDGETLIINDESLNRSMNLQVDSPMQQFYGADLDWPFLDNMSPAMDSTHSATNSNQIWSTDFQAGEEMDYWLNILRLIEPLPLFHLAPPSQVSSPIFTSVEH